jgi:hypothetical protein
MFQPNREISMSNPKNDRMASQNQGKAPAQKLTDPQKQQSAQQSGGQQDQTRKPGGTGGNKPQQAGGH